MFLRIIQRVLFGICLAASTILSAAPLQPLPSWADNALRTQIIQFIDKASDSRPASELIAVFDLDGTMVIEKPEPMEMYLSTQRLCSLHNENPHKYSTPVYTMACARNFTWLNENFNAVQLTAFNNTAQSNFNDYCAQFTRTAANPLFNTPLIKLFYQPMLELVLYLTEKDFTVYVVSGSEQGFIRALLKERDDNEDLQSRLGIPDSQVISEATLLSESDDGQFIRQYAFRNPDNWEKGKAINLRTILGRQKPVFAFGNTMGDFYMLKYATSSTENGGMALVLNHDDPDRECFYEDKNLLKNAQQLGWPIVSMKNDFRQLFPEGVPQKSGNCGKRF